MLHFIIELWQRFWSKTPPFFKKIIYASITVATTCVAMLTVPEYLPKWLDPEILKTAIAVASGMGLVAKLAINWNTVSPTDVPDVEAPKAVDIIKALTDKPEDEKAGIL
jgi:hypothetical protein